MEKNNRHSRKHYGNWNNQKNQNNKPHQTNERNDEGRIHKSPKFHYMVHSNPEALAKKEQAISDFKAREIVCPKCSQLITDMASALTDKATGKPIHFECVMEELNGSEKCGQNEKICYIGQGRFGILYFENPRDQRHFTIKKIIEWENRETKTEWRSEISGLYSQVE
ncbi:MAG: hypothetical protein UHP28_07015 [Treponema sp.]|nr:hypothetical protein [Treponema sp.]